MSWNSSIFSDNFHNGDGIKLYDSEIFVENFLKYKNASAGSSFMTMTMYGNSNLVNMDTLFSSTQDPSLTYGYVLYDNSSIVVGTNASSPETMGTIWDSSQNKTITQTMLVNLDKPFIIRANDEENKTHILTSDTTLTNSNQNIVANSGTSTVTLPAMNKQNDIIAQQNQITRILISTKIRLKHKRSLRMNIVLRID